MRKKSHSFRTRHLPARKYNVRLSRVAFHLLESMRFPASFASSLFFGDGQSLGTLTTNASSMMTIYIRKLKRSILPIHGFWMLPYSHHQYQSLTYLLIPKVLEGFDAVAKLYSKSDQEVKDHDNNFDSQLPTD